MEQLRSTWDAALGKSLSVTRIAGFALQWLWMFMMFYSIVPYSYSSDMRGALYSGLFISLVAMVVTLLFVAVIVRHGEEVGANKSIVVGSAIIMSLGSVLAPFADPNTPVGMLVLGISGIMTGTGSAVLFLCWVEQLSHIGGRLALVELAVSSCIAFIAGFILISSPALAVMVVIACLPFASALVLRKCKRADSQRVANSNQPLSRHTGALFVKALAGAALIGIIEGFFDVVSGYKTYDVQDVYGTYLFLAGFLGVLVVCLIGVFLHKDSIFFSYRFAMLVLCLGCLLTPFMKDNNTYSSALIFGGYHCYVLVLCVVCIDVATSFRISAATVIGLGFVALYGGEMLGYVVAYFLDFSGVPMLDLALVTLVGVSLLFISHLFLFTETDLIKIGIGEVNLMNPLPDEDAENVASPVDPCALIVDRYGLSPRESDVLPLLLEGRTISRIQEALYISAGTVSTHIRHIYQKTGVDNRQELIDLAHAALKADEMD